MANMKELFKGYADYSKEEYKRIWSNGIIVVDTNILLNFYRYSEDTRKSIYEILKKQKDRLWIPYYVGKEYFKNKNKVMYDSYNEYKSLLGTISDKIKEAKGAVESKKNTQLKCKEEIIRILVESQDRIKDILTKEQSTKKPEILGEKIGKEIIDLFNDSIGEEITGEEYKTIKAEGKRRVSEEIPPGYKDSSKPENGDYYIYYAFIKKAKQEEKDIIFVTDDAKEDWFSRMNGKTLGGRSELLNEFYNETGHLLLLYTADGFAEACNKNLEQGSANKDIIDELKEVRRMRDREYDNIVLSRLNYLKNNIEELSSPAEIFIALKHVIFRANVSRWVRDRAYQKLLNLKEYIYNNDEYEVKIVKDYIDDIVNYIELNTDNRSGSLRIDKEKYKLLSHQLKTAKNKRDKFEIYQKIMDYLMEELNRYKHYSREHNYGHVEKIEELVTTISKTIKADDEKSNSEIIDMLEKMSEEQVLLT